ncbi:hypothetical protein LSH36_116g01018, partial [Paralvinella palmiformis]
MIVSPRRTDGAVSSLLDSACALFTGSGTRIFTRSCQNPWHSCSLGPLLLNAAPGWDVLAYFCNKTQSTLSRACEIKNGFAGIIVKNSCTRRQKCGASKFQMNVFGIDSTVSFCTSIANTIRKG